ncbi:glycosyl hydrolase family 65 protein [Hoyosella altamirensis]|uniref:Trehalose 6-phosphate phosphatase n=1 Tax=Hoyosella altamirensis TaxID=616997 RepID=A0A839RLZ3_9ACTN|nr:trehalose 6-phosphate phosphatase [Hoyosella altamirensis]
MVDTWHLAFDHYDPASEKLREALCTVGNGYFASRGAAPEVSANQSHYPGTYIAGIFNRLTDVVSGTTVSNESLVNCTNWLPFSFRAGGSEQWFDIDRTDVLEYRQDLDMKRAVLERFVKVRDESGRVTRLTQRRFVSMDSPHVAALQVAVRPENWSGSLEVRSALDGGVRNDLVERYRDLSRVHFSNVETNFLTDDSVLIEAETTESRIRTAVAARTQLRHDHHAEPAEYRPFRSSAEIGHVIGVPISAGQEVTFDKVVTVYTGRDSACGSPSVAAARWLPRQGSFRALLDKHVTAWERLWQQFGIDVDGDERTQRIIRLHLLHILQTLSPHVADLDVGVPARGLHGEAYRGHIFWDDLFVFPVLNLRLPALTAALLRYRFRRLPEARQAALDAGYQGAMFPWQSGSDGREESQTLHLNPRSGRWNIDASQRAHHVGLAIAYNVWQYYQATADNEFLADFGAEILVEIARFWASRTEFDAVRERFVIRGVIGPDEFHSGYPEAPYDGIDNNAYTNLLAAWTLHKAGEMLALISDQSRAELLAALRIDEGEVARWDHISRRIFVPFHDGVISQFERYGKLRELDWDKYRKRHGDIQRLDRILEAEGEDVNSYQASKQADVLMLFYLFSSSELLEVLSRLGYHVTPDIIPRTIEYYLPRTSHGSTLSAVVHAWVLARSRRSHTSDFYSDLLDADLTDIQGGTTSEGIHLAAMAGSVDILQRCFSGLELRDDRIILNPCYPESLGTVQFGLRYRGTRLTVRAKGTTAEVCSAPGPGLPVRIECNGATANLSPGCCEVFAH